MCKADELLLEVDRAVDELERCRRRIEAMDHPEVRRRLGSIGPELLGVLLDDGDDAARLVAQALSEYHEERMK